MKNILLLTALFCIPFVGEISSAQDGPVEIVSKGCKPEIESYCKDVTPGEGRVLACLFAREDKLSAGCMYSLAVSSLQVELLQVTLTYLASECEDDLKTYCAHLNAGEGRLLDCLKKNEASVSARCKEAFQNVSNK